MAGQSAATPRGTLRLTCSHHVALNRIVPAIATFTARFPLVSFDVTVAERLVDLVDEGFDLAIRIGRIGSDQLVARRLGEVLRVTASI